MKSVRFVLIFAALLTVSTVGAQVRFGVKGGVNLSNAKFDGGATLKSENIAGYYLGPSLEAMLGRGGLGLDLALLYSRKGFDSDEYNTVANSYLEVPVNLKFKLGLPLVNPYVIAGPYIDFCVGGKKAWDTVKDLETQLKTKSFGAGLNFGLGVELFSKFQVGLNYSMALTDNYSTFDANDADSYKGKIVAGSLFAAYYF